MHEDLNDYSVQMHIDHMAQMSDACAISRAMAEDDDPVIVEPELIIRVLAAAEKYELIEWRDNPS